MPTQNRRNRQLPGNPNNQPGKEGKGGGSGPTVEVEEARELLVRCPHSHWHTNCTLDSLNNVNRPAPKVGLMSAAP